MNKRGFTLIELLVVISIISLLSSVVFSSLSSARTKARDAKNLASLKQLQTALALYYDKFGSYPYDPVNYLFLGYDRDGSTTFDTILTPLVTNGFVSQIPHGYNYPNNPFPYEFWYSAFGIACGGLPSNYTTYTIMFLSEKTIFNLPIYDVRPQGTRYCLSG